MFDNENKKKNILKSKKKHLKILPSKEELPTKKSTEAFPKADDNPAISVALMEPNAYIVTLRSKTDTTSTKSQEYNADKRFNIPRSMPMLNFDSLPQTNPTNVKFTAPIDRKATEIEDDAERHDYRTTRQEESVVNERFPILGSISDNSMQSVPVQAISTTIPAQSNIGEVGVRSDISAINNNKLLSVVPVKVETPVTMASPSSVAMVSQSKTRIIKTISLKQTWSLIEYSHC